MLCTSCGDGEAPDAPVTRPPATRSSAWSGPHQAVVTDPDDPAAYIYDQEAFRTFDLHLAPEDLARLDKEPTAEQYVPGSLRFEGIEYGGVGIRYKGSLGAWMGCTSENSMRFPLGIGGEKTCPKLSMKVSFNWSSPEGRFFGLKKLVFHAMNQDASLMRERMGYWLFRQMDAPAPRAVHVRLRINGVLAGVFLNVEYLDGRFTRNHFADGEGNLYKEVWPTRREGLSMPDREDMLAGLRTNEDEGPDVTGMLAFGQAVRQSEGEARAAVIRDWMSVEHTMAMIAVDRTIRADDGLFHFYCFGGGCQNHNFYIYEQARTRQIWVIPWDLDNSFAVLRGAGFNADGFIKIMDAWNDLGVACEPREGGMQYAPSQLPPSCDPLIRGWASFPDVYQAQLTKLLDGPFSEQTETRMLFAWRNQIGSTVAEAHALDGGQISPDAWKWGLADFTERTRILRDSAAASLRD